MLKVACIQIDCVPGDLTKNLEKAISMIHTAAAQGAEMVVLPELCNVGYDLNLVKEMHYGSKGFADTKAVFARAAQELGIHIAAGLLEVQDEAHSKLYNSLQVFNPDGEVIATYRKVCLFPLSFEERLFVPGQDAMTVTINGITLGLMICFDIRFPELSRQYFTEDCAGIIVASAFPFPRLDHWRTLLKSRAIENQMYIIAANRVGQDAGLQFLGNSCIIDPWGTVKATTDELEEAIVMHEIDPAKISEVRGRIACRETYHRLKGGKADGKG